jgi:hypothetical protein
LLNQSMAALISAGRYLNVRGVVHLIRRPWRSWRIG